MSVVQRFDTATTVLSLKTSATARMRQRFSCITMPIAENDEDIDPLGELLNQTWNIWGVSPLFQFHYQSERHLKLYAKRLREEVASLLPKEDVKYDVKFEISQSIAPRPNTNDPPAIKIQIFTENIETEVQKTVYTGFLISWGSVIPESDMETCVKLPLLLSRGNKTAINAVNVTLTNMFDCIIVQLPATEEDLRWLAPITLNLDEENEQKGQMNFEYTIPGLPKTDSITFSWEISMLIKLWTVICECDDNVGENEFTLHNVDRFYQFLQKQVLQDAGLQLGFTKLTKINLPYFTIMDSKIKASTPQVLNKVLLFFNENAIEILHLLNFDTSRHSTVSNASR